MSSGLTTIACGRHHTLLCTSNGIVFSTGRNGAGQCGLGDFSSPKSPELIHFGKDDAPLDGYENETVVIPQTRFLVSMGDTSYILTTRGYVYSFGCGKFGQLGLGALRNECEPKRVKIGKFDECISLISCGVAHCWVVSQKNEVFCVGSNAHGQLGLEGGPKLNKMRKVFTRNHFFLDKTVSEISCGKSFTVFKTPVGIFGCGQISSDLKLGINISVPISLSIFFDFNKDIISSISKIESGYEHLFVLTKDDKVYGLGERRYLGIGTSGSTTKAELVEDFCGKEICEIYSRSNKTYFVTDKKIIYALEGSLTKELESSLKIRQKIFKIKLFTRVEGVDEKIRVFHGQEHTLFVADSDRFWGWGSNNSLQLGLDYKCVVNYRSLEKIPRFNGIMKWELICTEDEGGKEKKKEPDDPLDNVENIFLTSPRSICEAPPEIKESERPRYQKIRDFVERRRKIINKLEKEHFLGEGLKKTIDANDARLKNIRELTKQIFELIDLENVELNSLNKATTSIAKLLMNLKKFRKENKISCDVIHKTEGILGWSKQVVYFGSVLVSSDPSKPLIRHGKLGKEYEKRMVIFAGKYENDRRHGYGIKFDNENKELEGTWYRGKFFKLKKVAKEIPKIDIEVDCTIRARLGRGTTSVVFWATSKKFGECAIKKIKVTKNDPDKSKRIYKMRESDFLRECEKMVVIRHPNFVDLYAWSPASSGILGCVMELCHKNSLAHIVNAHEVYERTVEGSREKPMYDLNEWGNVIRVLYQIAAGMEKLHGENMCHFDLNFYLVDSFFLQLNNKDEVKIIDLGISQDVEIFKITDNRRSCGSPFFAAPESILRETVEEHKLKVDVYSYGIIIFCLLVKTNNPYNVSTDIYNKQHLAKIFCDSYSQNEEIRPDLDKFQFVVTDENEWLVELMKECWAHHPQDRKHSFRDIRVLFEKKCKDVCLKIKSKLFYKKFID